MKPSILEGEGLKVDFYKTRTFRASFRVYKRLCKYYTFAPRQVKIEATKLCNLKCIGCRRWLEGNISKQLGPNHLTLEVLQFIVKQLPLKAVRFGGDGEPTVNPYLIDMLRYLGPKGIRSSYTTNGVLLNKELIKASEDYGVVRISISYTGAKKETFERMRDGAKFNEVYENTLLAGKSKAPVFLDYAMLTKEVIEEIPEIIRIARETNATGIMFLRPMATSVGDFELPDFLELSHILREAKAEMERYGIEWEGNLGPTPIFQGCSDPYVLPFITLDGNVFGCQQMANQRLNEMYAGEVLNLPSRNYVMGNVYEQNLKEIWKNGYYKELRIYLKEIAVPRGTTISREELNEMRKHKGNARFSNCYACLSTWGEAGTNVG